MAAVLRALSRLEQIVCVAAFVIMAGALVADVGKRLLGRFAAWLDALPWVSGLSDAAAAAGLGSGLMGAPQVAVVGLITLAMFGFGVAAQHGAHLRPRLLDGIFPISWSRWVNRAADGLTAGVLGGLAWLSGAMAGESAALGDVSSVLRWPIWPIQAAIAVAFGLNALRYLIFSIRPDLRPNDDGLSELPDLQEASR